MNPKLMNMNKIGEFLDIFITSKNRREALERAHVHAKAAGLWDTYSPEEREEFTFFCYYLWMAAGDKRKQHQQKQNPMLLLPDGEDERPDDAYHPGELALGIQVEMEHTNEIRIAKRIAKDHLDEIKNYYSLLILMEKMHHDVTGQFFGDYFDAMGNKLQVAYMRAERLPEGDPLRSSVESMKNIYKDFKNELVGAEKKMKPMMVRNPQKVVPAVIIQSVSFMKVKFNKAQAKKWLKAHGFKVKDFDDKMLTMRFRQHSPALFKNYCTKKYACGILLTLGTLKRHTKGRYRALPRAALYRPRPPKDFANVEVF